MRLLLLLVLSSCSPAHKYVRAERPAAIEGAPRRYQDGHVFYWANERWYVEHQGEWYEYPPAPQPQNDWKWRR